MKKKIINWTITLVLFLAVAGLGFVYFVPGYSLKLVRSGSMTPAIRMGDVIITGPVGGQINGEVKPGRIVTYQYGDDLITHRVLSLNGEKLTMKGDALEEADPWKVTLSDVKGVYLFKIPYIGFALNFVRTKLGWFIAVILPSLVLVGWLCRDILKEAFSDSENAPTKVKMSPNKIARTPVKKSNNSLRMAKSHGIRPSNKKRNDEHLREVAKRYGIRIV